MSRIQTFLGRIRRVGDRIRKGCCCTPCGEYSLSIDLTQQACCCFDFSFTIDPAEATTIVSQEWDFGDGATSTEANPTHCFESPGPHTVTLQTTDAEGCVKTAQAEVACTECASGEEPEAAFSYSQTDADPCAFAFTDESTVTEECEGREIVAWLWDFGDGNTSTIQNPTHSYTGSGPWDVTLTVTDNFGCEDVVVMEVACETAPGTCTSCCDGDFFPPTVAITLAGIIDNATCPECTDLNGQTITLTRQIFDGGSFTCAWAQEVDGGGVGIPIDSGVDSCAAGNFFFEACTISVSCIPDLNVFRVQASVTIRRSDGLGGNRNINFLKDFAVGVSCRGTFALDFAGQNYPLPAPSAPCRHDTTTQITVTI